LDLDGVCPVAGPSQVDGQEKQFVGVRHAPILPQTDEHRSGGHESRNVLLERVALRGCVRLHAGAQSAVPLAG
jgi:hypothetical protein